MFPSGEKYLYHGLMLMNLMVLGVTTDDDDNRTDGVFSLLSSTRMSPRQDSPDDRGRGAGPLYQIQGDLPQPAHPAGA